MKKKIMLLLLLILVIPISAKAEGDVKITNIQLLDKAENTKILEEPTYSLRKANFNIKFSEVGDYAKYKITVKNESNEDYEISNETKFLDNEYIKYEFSYDGSNILKVGETKDLQLIFTYNKEVPQTSFNDGKYTSNNVMQLELVNDNIIVNVPKTYKGYTKAMIALGAVAIIIAIILLIRIKNTKVKTIALISLLALPITAYALQKISLEINTKIEIEKAEEKVYAINTHDITTNTSSLDEIGPTYSSCAETGKNVCLRYTLKDNIVTHSEVCFIYNNEEKCIEVNETQEKNIEKLTEIFAPNLCETYENYFSCNNTIYAYANNIVNTGANDGTWKCDINNKNISYCGKHHPVS